MYEILCTRALLTQSEMFLKNRIYDSICHYLYGVPYFEVDKQVYKQSENKELYFYM